MITDGQDTQKRAEDPNKPVMPSARRGAVGQIVTGSKQSTTRPRALPPFGAFVGRAWSGAAGVHIWLFWGRDQPWVVRGAAFGRAVAGVGTGAGAIIALEAMRILRALNLQPRRTIRIGLWGGEEQGLFGSAGYVSNHFATLSYSTKPEEQVVPEFLRQQTRAIAIKPEHSKFDAYFNTDNGGGKFLGIFTEGNSAVANIFQQWIAPISDLGFTTITLRNTGSTDHVSFDQVGLPGFQFIQDPRDYETRSAHTNQDTYERLSEPDLKQAAVIMAIFVYNTAERDAMLPRKPMPHPELEEQLAKPLEGIYPSAAKQ